MVGMLKLKDTEPVSQLCGNDSMQPLNNWAHTTDSPDGYPYYVHLANLELR